MGALALGTDAIFGGKADQSGAGVVDRRQLDRELCAFRTSKEIVSAGGASGDPVRRLRGSVPVLCIVRARGVQRWEHGVLVVAIDRLTPTLQSAETLAVHLG